MSYSRHRTMTNSITPRKALNKAYLKSAPDREGIELFKKNLVHLLDSADDSETEEFHKNLIIEFLKHTYYKKDYFINTKGRSDLVIHNSKTTDSSVGVLIETKKPTNKHEMITHGELNKKALQEVVLYYLRERVNENNIELKQLVVSNIYEWFIFDSSVFEKYFAKNKSLVKNFQEWQSKSLSGTDTDFFYREIASPVIEDVKDKLTYTYFDFRKYEKAVRNSSQKDDSKLISLYKLLGPTHMLKQPFANDSNTLNSKFYSELLHIIGLGEVKKSGKKLIQRNKGNNRHAGSLIENTIKQLDKRGLVSNVPDNHLYGKTDEERLFNVSLELCITWINRLLFLKLLESQLISYHSGDDSFGFLNLKKVKNFDDLDDLFFAVLAKKTSERSPDVISRYGLIPYLNSSLFESTNLEKSAIYVSNLEDDRTIPLYERTVLLEKGKRRTGSLSTLEYLFDFLSAYDFASEGREEIAEVQKTLINASVLGLIFEKINGYQDGSIFTPGFITMYMSRETIRKTIIQKFNLLPKYKDVQSFDDLKEVVDTTKEGRDEANQVINSIKVIDPAVGSGHFLVSVLNEVIAIKSELGVLNYRDGSRIKHYKVEIDNDELSVFDEEEDELFKYTVGLKDGSRSVSDEKQKLQEALFHEKQTIIENCLFGVDINKNSVNICRLRLWIELLKNAYYSKDSGFAELETLPNIDINIKCGNSLVSRFQLDTSLKLALKKKDFSIEDYKSAVRKYQHARSKDEKREMEQLISTIKSDFRVEINDNSREVVRLRKLKGELHNLENQTELDFFRKESKRLKKETEKLKREINKLENLIQQIKQNKVFENAFEWRFEFPEVLDEEGSFVGFDTVIANPPYMRVQEIQKTQPVSKEFYEQSFVNATASYDLANLFFELAVNISSEESQNSFIFPHKFFNSSSTETFRNYLMNGKYIDKLSHFGANMIFDDADTYTCVAQFSKESNEGFMFQRFPFKSDYKVNLWLNENYSYTSYEELRNASKLYGSNQFILFDNEIGGAIFNKLYQDSILFSECFEGIFQGIATSKDDLYILKVINESEVEYTLQMSCNFKDEIIEREYQVEKRYFKPFLMGKDVHRYKNLASDIVVFFPYDVLGESANPVDLEVLKTSFPLTYEYLIDNEEIFKARESGKAEKLKPWWYQYIYPKNLNKFEQEKLSSMEICASHPNVTINSQNFYHTTKVYSWVRKESCKLDYKLLLAIANSKVLWWFLKLTGDTLQGDARTFKTNYLNPFPIPNHIDEHVASQTTELVDEILELKANDDKSDTKALEAQLDELVYEMYGLNDAEIKEVERLSW